MIYAARSNVIASGVVHLAGWAIGVAEVAIVFAFMGHPVGIGAGLLTLYAVPGALVVLCAAFGIPPEQAIALSLVKRAADLVLGVPGLLGWQMLEWGRLAELPQAAGTRARQSSFAKPLSRA